MNANYELVISARSPFARRARIALLRLGVAFTFESVNVFEPPTWLFTRNPLGLVPILRTPAGLELADSAMILEYLEESRGQKIWPKDPAFRARVRQHSTWLEGAMLAVVNFHLEELRSVADAEYLSEHRTAVERVLDMLDRELLQQDTQAACDLVVLLDYIALRMPRHLDWKKRWADLAPIHARYAHESAFVGTAPPPA